MNEQLEHVNHVLDVYLKEGPEHADDYLFGYVGDHRGPVTVTVLAAALRQAEQYGKRMLRRMLHDDPRPLPDVPEHVTLARFAQAAGLIVTRLAPHLEAPGYYDVQLWQP